MSGKSQRDYGRIKQQLTDAIRNGQPARWTSLARLVGVDPGTLRSAAQREWNITDPMELIGHALSEQMPQKLGRTVSKGVNTLELEETSLLVRTLDQLLKVCKVDTAIWDVRDHVINQWQVAMKIRKGDKDEPITLPLFQIKAWLIRKKLRPIIPTIQPISLPAPKLPPKPKTSSPLKRALILPDIHIGFRRPIHSAALQPFHDRLALDIVLQIIQDTPLHNISLIGDVLDLAEWSTHWTPEPEFYFTTQPALIEWAWWLHQYRAAAPHAQIHQWEGNHDKRLSDMIVAYMRAAYGLRPVDEIELPPSMSVARLLALHTLGVEYIQGYPDNTRWLNRNVLIRHGDTVRSGPGDSAKAVVTKTTYTTVFGHIHRRELVTRRIKTREGDSIQTAYCPGCLCHVDGRVPGSTSESQWQQGIAIIEYTDDFENIISIPIHQGRAIYNGKHYTARDHTSAIETMLTQKLSRLA